MLSLFVQVLNCFFGVLLSTGALQDARDVGSSNAEDKEGRCESMGESMTSLVLVALNVLVVFLPLLQLIADDRLYKLKFATTMGKMEAMNEVHRRLSREGSRGLLPAGSFQITGKSTSPENRSFSAPLRIPTMQEAAAESQGAELEATGEVGYFGTRQALALGHYRALTAGPGHPCPSLHVRLPIRV